MMSEKDLFIKYKEWWQLSADSSTDKNVNFEEIDIIQLQIDNQVLILKNIWYDSNLKVNLIFYEALIQDEFDIHSISTADDLHLLQIIDTENQKFNAVITDSNVFFI